MTIGSLRLHGMQPGEEQMELPRLFRIVDELMSGGSDALLYYCEEIQKLTEPRDKVLIWAELSYIVIAGTRLRLMYKPKRNSSEQVVFTVKPWLQKSRKKAQPLGALLTPKPK